jgi:hypothetical protein
MSNDTPPLDEGTRKLGLLMEAAHTHQELIDGSLRQLQAHTQGLDQVVRDEIRRAFIAELAELIDESARAAAVLRALGRAATLRVAWWGALIGLVPGVIMLLLLWCWLPAPGRIAALRAERGQLSAAIAQLADGGGRIDLRRCGDASRLCVRIDRRAPAYGEQADFLVVRGY